MVLFEMSIYMFNIIIRYHTYENIYMIILKI